MKDLKIAELNTLITVRFKSQFKNMFKKICVAVFILSLNMAFAETKALSQVEAIRQAEAMPSTQQIIEFYKEGNQAQIEQCFVNGMNSKNDADFETAYVCGSTMVLMGSRDPQINQAWLDDHFEHSLNTADFQKAQEEMALVREVSKNQKVS